MPEHATSASAAASAAAFGKLRPRHVHDGRPARQDVQRMRDHRLQRGSLLLHLRVGQPLRERVEVDVHAAVPVRASDP
jgi:hypothetical protein